LFFESVFVAVICRPGSLHSPEFLHPVFLGRHAWTQIPQLALFTFAATLILLLVRLVLLRKPVESGLLWSLATAFIALGAGGVGRTATGYLATAGFILVSSIIENSYLLAYHDELTTLPARRAFNDAILNLQAPYAVAVVDIDHFKRFNDTYGHETGDQVLRMVAARLAGISGGGKAYRVGGEEFTILFPGKSLKEVQPHLELLRTAVENSAFHLRGGVDRRSLSRVPDQTIPDRRRRRRKDEDRRSPAPKVSGPARSGGSAAGRDISVTVSIGVAESNAKTREAELVIQAADKALYRAKRNGRNRVESATTRRSYSAVLAKSGVA
jgi:diguanylate cyclase (GGDEF)-like protein